MRPCNIRVREQPIIGYNNLTQEVIYGPAVPVSGLRLVDGRGSYGISLSTFALGFPLHFDWSKLTDLQRSSSFKFDFWVGFDF